LACSRPRAHPWLTRRHPRSRISGTFRIGDRGEWHEGHAIGESVLEIVRDAQRQASLADAPRSGEREEAHVVPAHQHADLLHFALAADERGQRRGEGRAAGRGTRLRCG
jgi:hypothetical protein